MAIDSSERPRSLLPSLVDTTRRVFGFLWRCSTVFLLVVVALILLRRLVLWSQPRLHQEAVGMVCAPSDGSFTALGVNEDGEVLVAGVRVGPHQVENQLWLIERDGPTGYRVVSELPVESRATHIVIDGTIAYVFARRLLVYDISDLAAPRQISSLDWTMEYRGYRGRATHSLADADMAGVAISGTILAAHVGDHGVGFVDIADPLQPTLAGWLPMRDPGIDGNPADGIALLGTHAYVSNGDLYVVDFADPSAPFEVGAVNISEQTYSQHALAVDERHRLLYVAAKGLHWIDLSEPTAPRYMDGAKANALFLEPRLPWWDEQDYYTDVALTPKGAVVSTYHGMFVEGSARAFDRRNPIRPRMIVGKLQNAGAFSKVESDGDTVYIVGGKSVESPDCKNAIVALELSIEPVWPWPWAGSGR